MKKTFLLTAILFQIFTISIFAQKKTYYTNRITTKPPVIDGVLNDDEWGKIIGKIILFNLNLMKEKTI